MRRKTVLNLAGFFALLFASGCFPFTQSPTAVFPSADTYSTSAAETIQSYVTEFVRQTQEAGETVNANPATTSLASTPSSRPIETVSGPTRRPIPSSTPTQSATAIATPSATILICNLAKFIQDVTIPDGTRFTGNDPFIKTWRLKNIGSCEWTDEYDLVFHSGDSLGGLKSVSFTKNVLPGETVDLSVNLVAPNNVGEYTGNWKLRSDSGNVFGLSASGNEPFWVKIEVTALASTPDPNLPLDFAASYCLASWSSSKISGLSCPSAQEDFTNGSIQRDLTPRIELNVEDNEVALIMIPSDETGGIISGRYPAVNIQVGDRFTALTGCMGNSPNCTVTFKLNYSVDGGPRQNLKTWTEIYDGNRTHVDIDLSALADQSVVLILEVDNNNGSSQDDRAFWMVPRIIR